MFLEFAIEFIHVLTEPCNKWRIFVFGSSSFSRKLVMSQEIINILGCDLWLENAARYFSLK